MVFSIFTIFLSFHTYYYSFTEMEYNVKEKSMETSIKLTSHDIEKEIEEMYDVDIDFNVSDDNTKRLLLNYLTKYFTIAQKGKTLELELIGFENELSGDLYIYLKFNKIKIKKPFSISQKVLFSTFPNQKNVVTVKTTMGEFNKVLTNKESTFFMNQF